MWRYHFALNLAVPTSALPGVRVRLLTFVNMESGFVWVFEADVSEVREQSY